ncbi:hypothetical protein UlMin_034726 [Ulmus minor]
MLVAGGLGFQSLVLVVCLFVPVISFVVRSKWRLAGARKEEIKRLLILASEEAARAELEASAGYGAVSAVASYNQCAVCYSPTTTRCARCKAVRYCSGKCQIIHWRQGHKGECRPPSPTRRTSDAGSISGQKLSKEELLETYIDNFEGSGRAKPIKIFPKEAVCPANGYSPEASYEKDDGSEVESLFSGKGSNPSSSPSSFSGFSASTKNSELSDDVSVSESFSSVETDRSDGNISADDTLPATCGLKDVNDSELVSPKFASLVTSVNGFTKVNKSNKVESNCGDGQHQRVSTSCPSHLTDSGVCDGPIAKPCESSSRFWDRALDSAGSPNDIHDDSDASDSSGSGSSYYSGSTSPLCAEGSAEKVTPLDDAIPDMLDVKKLVSGSFLTENIGSNVSKIRDSRSSNYETSENRDNKPKSVVCDIKREVKSIPLSSVGVSRCTASSNVIDPSTRHAKLNHATNDCSRTNLLKSTERRCSVPSVFDAHLPSGIKDSSITRSKTRDADSVQASAAVSSEVSNSPNVKNGLKTSVQRVVEQFKGSKMSKQYSLGNRSDIVGKYSDKVLFPYELFVKLYHWNKVELRPSGLENCGNSCYANAVLQCLAFTPPLTAFFLQGLHSKACIKKEWCFMCEFESLILKAREGKTPLSPIGILSQLRNIGSQLNNGREEDAHEFLRYAIDTMQSVCLRESGVNASGPLEEETTLVGLTFGGYLRSKIKCTKCEGKSERHENMMDLTVEIEGDIGTLEEALRKFTSTETLDGENKYKCSRCKSYEKAKKKLTILEAPNILTIALKRFQSGKFGKLNKPIRFPEILNLAPFMSGTSDKLAIYRLYGVVVHLDVMNASFSGHYVCYVKNIQNKWFKIDDSTVTPVELEKVLSKGAYMLLYARCSPRAPRLMRNKMASLDPKTRSKPSWIGGNATILKPKSMTNSSVPHSYPSSNPPEGSASYESFYSKYQRLQRILEEDSSSDNSSLISNNSDEGSWSTDSTRDSTSADDLSDYIFGEGRGWYSPYRNPSDSETSSSSSSTSSPLFSANPEIAKEDGRPSHWPSSGNSRRMKLEGEGSAPFLHSDSAKQGRKLGSSSSSSRKTDLERLESDSLNNVKSDVSFRRSSRERTANI